MNAKQRRETDRNIRARDFMTENAANFSGNTIAAAKITALMMHCARSSRNTRNK